MFQSTRPACGATWPALQNWLLRIAPFDESYGYFVVVEHRDF